jgi:hypothetical protein
MDSSKTSRELGPRYAVTVKGAGTDDDGTFGMIKLLGKSDCGYSPSEKA